MATVRAALACVTGCAIISFGLAGRAAAQAGVSATVESDYRYRGVSLTDGRADARFGVAYDHSSGGYAGASIMVGKGAAGGVQPFGYITYAGLAKRTGGGLTLDVGATASRITQSLRPPPSSHYQPLYPYTPSIPVDYAATYAEVYAGVTRRNLSGRVYLSPNYLGQGRRTAYLDLSGSIRPSARVRLFAHAGYLAPIGGSGMSTRSRWDVRTGAALLLPHGELQLAWTAVQRRVEFPTGYPQRRSGLVASASAYF